jgi:hypothetical protein
VAQRKRETPESEAAAAVGTADGDVVRLEHDKAGGVYWSVQQLGGTTIIRWGATGSWVDGRARPEPGGLNQVSGPLAEKEGRVRGKDGAASVNEKQHKNALAATKFIAKKIAEKERGGYTRVRSKREHQLPTATASVDGGGDGGDGGDGGGDGDQEEAANEGGGGGGGGGGSAADVGDAAVSPLAPAGPHTAVAKPVPAINLRIVDIGDFGDVTGRLTAVVKAQLFGDADTEAVSATFHQLDMLGGAAGAGTTPPELSELYGSSHLVTAMFVLNELIQQSTAKAMAALVRFWSPRPVSTRHDMVDSPERCVLHCCCARRLNTAPLCVCGGIMHEYSLNMHVNVLTPR